MILRVRVQGGEGGVVMADISAILPDVNNPDDSVVYTTLFPSGLSVKGSAIEHCALWFVWLEGDLDDEDEDDE